MSYLLEVFGAIPFSSVLIFIAAIAFVVTICYKLYQVLTKFHDELKERNEQIVEIAANVKELKNKQNELEVTVSNLAAAQKTFEDENKARKKNELRDRLLQSYRFYTSPVTNPTGNWNEMEKETFDKLFEDYEKLGGNGFMHTVVYPEMMKLPVIPV